MLIGLCGKSGSGKSTISKYLIEKGFIEYFFSEPLKKIAEIFQFENYQIYGTQENKMEINKNWNISCREFLQKIGTDVFRNNFKNIFPDSNIDCSVWIKLFKIWYSRNNEIKNIVISDIRFQDEADAIKSLGGILIKVNRENKIECIKHSSELELEFINCDYIIHNDDTFDALFKNVNEILNI